MLFSETLSFRTLLSSCQGPRYCMSRYVHEERSWILIKERMPIFSLMSALEHEKVMFCHQNLAWCSAGRGFSPGHGAVESAAAAGVGLPNGRGRAGGAPFWRGRLPGLPRICAGRAASQVQRSQEITLCGVQSLIQDMWSTRQSSSHEITYYTWT